MGKAIKLETSIKRAGDGGDVAKVTVTKPNAGQLRGTKLTDLLQMDVTAMITLLPRITEPALLPAEVAAMDPADFTALSTEVVTFLAGKSRLAEMGLATG